MASREIVDSFCKKHAGSNDRDRIGKLPDAVLHHVLSFLPTRQVVQLGVLSRRWRSLWSSMNHLDLYNGLSDSEDKIESFEHFVDTVLLLRDHSDLSSFRLHCNGYFDKRRVTRWVCYALKRNVKILEVRANRCIDFSVCIFSCKYLEELTLTVGRDVKLNHSNFQCQQLRKLYLNEVKVCQELLEKFVSKCLALEEFELLGCSVERLDISSHTLRNLHIEDCPTESITIRISCPGLLSLCYYNHFDERQEILLEKMPSLVRASIHVPKWTDVRSIRELANAKFLELSGPWIQRISENELSGVPKFQNLRSLMLSGEYMSENIKTITCFLQHSPAMELLTIENLEALNARLDEERPEMREMAFECPLLKVIVIRCYERSDKIHKAVKHLVSKADALEKLIIIPDAWT